MTLETIPWVIEEQTKVKHRLLEEYIDVWMAVMFSQQDKIGVKQRLVYVDGFGGPGIYWADELKKATVPGSPVIVAEQANKFLDKNPTREVVIFGIDNDQRCVKTLQTELNNRNKHKQHWKALHTTFEEAVNILFDYLVKDGKHIAPMFFFIDPFGYSGFKMETLKRILKHPRTELFVNLMTYDISRFLTADHASESLEQLFGTRSFAGASNLTGDERVARVVDLYCRQLQHVAGAEFVQRFRINTPGQGTRPKYFLIHGSKHLKALKVMKDAMKKHSTQSFRFEAIGLDPSRQLDLFEPSSEEKLCKQIHAYLRGHSKKDIPYEEVEAWAYVTTGGVASNIKAALLRLVKEQDLRIHRLAKQKRSTVTKGATIERPQSDGVTA